MPIYEYRCIDCKKPFEIVRAISAEKSNPVKCLSLLKTRSGPIDDVAGRISGR